MIDPKHRGYFRDHAINSCIGFAVPRVAFFWAPSATLRVNAPWPAPPKTKRGWRRCARDDASSLSSNLVRVRQLGVVWRVALFQFRKDLEQLMHRFPMGPKHVFFMMGPNGFILFCLAWIVRARTHKERRNRMFCFCFVVLVV